ncbi:MAG: putative toxin-antitoxin system toxin component, PIN family [Oscillospiraceae bacterium]|nr:putative toxin-antitoxin system toxin component, PIN family [Oscillospiraceae bacterium]
MKCYAVVDTNVIVAALITKNPSSPTVAVLHEILGGRITPLYNEEILAEYNEVLHREKFHLKQESVQVVLYAVKQFGLSVTPTPTGIILPDMDDLVFYEIAMEKSSEGAWLITGNQKHYPPEKFVVTPAEMMQILSNDDPQAL